MGSLQRLCPMRALEKKVEGEEEGEEEGEVLKTMQVLV